MLPALPLALAVRLLRREWRGGEIGLLFVSLVLAVALVTGIGVFVDRLQRALVGEASVYLGADAVVQSNGELKPAWREAAQQLGLKVAQTAVFPTMVYAGDAMHLVSLKAVSAGFPLRGALQVEDAGGMVSSVQHGPLPGTVWLDGAALAALDAKVGSDLQVGDSVLRVAYVIRHEPDARNSLVSMGDRLMMAMDDLPATHLLQAGSRLEYHTLFAGERERVDELTAWLKPQLKRSQRLLTLEDNQPGVASALQRASLFLQLAGALAVLLALLAAAMAAHRYSERHVDMVAVMKTLGATGADIIRLLLLQLAMLWLLSTLSGFAAAWLVQRLLLVVLAAWLPAVVPASGSMPFVLGAVTGLLAVGLFVAPPFIALVRVPPWRVLRSTGAGNGWFARLPVALAGMCGVAALLRLYTGQWQLVLWLMAGLLGLVLVATLIGFLLLRSSRLFGSGAGSALKLAVANIRRQPVQTSLQVSVFAVSFMLLAVIVLLRTSLLKEWQLQMPPGTPNQFLVNIAPDQLAPLQDALRSAGIEVPTAYPMVKGRLTTINGVLATQRFDESVNAVYRELNLSWTTVLPPDNRLVAGQWPLTPRDDGRIPVSIEEKLATTLQVKTGDQLTFTVEGRELPAVVASVRALQWEKMTPNFYFLFPPDALQDASATYITSVHVPAAQSAAFAHLMRDYPTVTVFPVQTLIERVQTIVARASAAVEVILSLVLLAGVLVLLACLRASLDARLHEGALLRTLGARRALLLTSLLLEFCLIGLAAGMLAAAGAEATAWALQTHLFHMTFAPHVLLWWLTPACSCALIAGAGLWFCRRVVSVPPAIVLREG